MEALEAIHAPPEQKVVSSNRIALNPRLTVRRFCRADSCASRALCRFGPKSLWPGGDSGEVER
jgi:hypothetical protein